MDTTTIERKQTAFSLRTDLLERLKIMASRSNRSLNNFVECMLMDAVYNEPNTETISAIKEAQSGIYAGKLDITDMETFINSVNNLE
jgi:hypothetical protein